MDNEIIVYKQNGIFFFAIKKNKFMSFAGKWMQLKIILLGELSHMRKMNTYVFSYGWILDFIHIHKIMYVNMT